MIERTPPPAQVNLERITVEQVDLYHHVQPLRENVPISIEPFQVEDSVSSEGKIEWVVWRLQKNRSGVPLGMRVEHRKGLIEEALKEEAVEATRAPWEEGTEAER